MPHLLPDFCYHIHPSCFSKGKEFCHPVDAANGSDISQILIDVVKATTIRSYQSLLLAIVQLYELKRFRIWIHQSITSIIDTMDSGESIDILAYVGWCWIKEKTRLDFWQIHR